MVTKPTDPLTLADRVVAARMVAGNVDPTEARSSVMRIGRVWVTPLTVARGSVIVVS